MIADATGRASFAQPVPNWLFLLGLPPHFRWFAFDPGASAVGLIASGYLLAIIGNQ